MLIISKHHSTDTYAHQTLPEHSWPRNFYKNTPNKICKETLDISALNPCILLRLQRCRSHRQRHAKNWMSPITGIAFVGLMCRPPRMAAPFPLWNVGQGSTPDPSSSRSLPSPETRSANGSAHQLPQAQLQTKCFWEMQSKTTWLALTGAELLGEKLKLIYI